MSNILLEVVLTKNYGWTSDHKSESDDDCRICYDSFKDESILILPCGHMYHNNCIIASIKVGKLRKCPELDCSHIFRPK